MPAGGDQRGISLNPHAKAFTVPTSRQEAMPIVRYSNRYAGHGMENMSSPLPVIQERGRSEEALLAMAFEFHRPKSELKKFSGDVMEYKRFIRQFNLKILAYTTDDEDRMNFLDQYTTKDANKIVTSHSHQDAKYGFPAAMAELEENYGDVEAIAHAFIKKALDWPVIKRDNPKGIKDFVVFLTECCGEYKLYAVPGLHRKYEMSHNKITTAVW
ncbi:uncharacterized protein LOC144434179 [Glandiceps talaboti]